MDPTQHQADAYDAAPFNHLKATPWTFKIDEELTDDERRFVRDTMKDESVRYVQILDSRGERVCGGWHNPEVTRLLAAAPRLLEVLEQIIGLEEGGLIGDRVVTDGGKRKYLISEVAKELLQAVRS